MRFLIVILGFVYSTILFSQKNDYKSGIDSIVLELSQAIQNKEVADQLLSIRSGASDCKSHSVFNFELYDCKIIQAEKDIQRIAHIVSKNRNGFTDEALLKFYVYELQFLIRNNKSTVPRLRAYADFAFRTELFKSINNQLYRYKGIEALFASYHQIGAFEKMKAIAELLVHLTENEKELYHFRCQAKLYQSISLAYDGNFEGSNKIIGRMLPEVSTSSELYNTLLFSQTINYFQSDSIEKAVRSIPYLREAKQSSDYPRYISLCVDLFISNNEPDSALYLFLQYEKEILQKNNYPNWYYPYVSLIRYYESTEQFSETDRLLEKIRFPGDFYRKSNLTSSFDISLLIYNYKKLLDDKENVSCETIRSISKELKHVLHTLKDPVEWISYPNDLDNYLRSLMSLFELSLEVSLLNQNLCNNNDLTLAFDVIEFSKNIEFFTRFSDDFVDKRLNYRDNELSAFFLNDKNIHPDRMYLNYFYGDEYIYCLRLFNQKLKLFRLVKTVDVEQSLYDFINLIHNYTPSKFFKDNTVREEEISVYQDLAFLIYSKIIEPLLESEEINDWVVYPDEILHFLPFDALIDAVNDCAAGWEELNYLMLTTNIHYINNLKSLFSIDTIRNGRIPGILAVKHDRMLLRPLKNNEIRYIKKAFVAQQVNNTFFKSASDFINAVKEHSIVILSMHSYTPKESDVQVFMDFGNFELYPTDIMNTDLDTELIILGSCMSSVGKQLRGWGSLSLPNSFELAGIKSQIGMIWKIDDEASANVIKETVRFLESGELLSLSLTRAKRNYLNNGNYFKKHPFYWAAAKSYGLDQPIKFPPRKERSDSWKYPLWISGILLIVGTGFLIIKKRSSDL